MKNAIDKILPLIDKDKNVIIPIKFEDVTIPDTIRGVGDIEEDLTFIKDHKTVISHYRFFMEKVGGMMVGFHFNPFVRKQSELNDRISLLLEDLVKQREKTTALLKEVDDLQLRARRLS